MYNNFNNSGYDGWSMSVRAREAYDCGEMPLTSWTKAELLDAIEQYEDSLPIKAESLSKVPVAVLRRLALKRTSWHHTGKYYNRTDFYSIDFDELEKLTDEVIKEQLELYKKERAEKKVVPRYRGDIEYIEWTGTREHIRANEKELKNVIIEERGSMYVVFDDDNNEILRKKKNSIGTFVTKRNKVRSSERG